MYSCLSVSILLVKQGGRFSGKRREPYLVENRLLGERFLGALRCRIEAVVRGRRMHGQKPGFVKRR